MSALFGAMEQAYDLFSVGRRKGRRWSLDVAWGICLAVARYESTSAQGLWDEMEERLQKETGEGLDEGADGDL